MPLETIPFDAAEHLSTPEAQAELIADALATGDSGYIAHAIGVVARARGMSAIARDAGLSREALYRGLSEDGDPRLSTLLAVFKALGVELSARLAPNSPPAKPRVRPARSKAAA